jgi:hypothetical protein
MKAGEECNYAYVQYAVTEHYSCLTVIGQLQVAHT